MIVVLADDLSGAAELANAAVQQGYPAEVQTKFQVAPGTAVICVDLGTRQLSSDAAARNAGEVARAVVSAGVDWVFHKCDSVLRGSVVAEARAIAAALGRERILLVPANPSRDRIIRHGRYFVGDVPLHETPFAHDPTHPRHSSEIAALLGAGLSGVTVPDVATADEVRGYAQRMDDDSLPSGAVDFFSALLARRGGRPGPEPVREPAALPALLVCGSAAGWHQREADAAGANVPIFLLGHAEPRDVARALGAHGRALVGIGAIQEINLTPGELADGLARFAVQVAREASVTTLLVEGGTTARAVLDAAGWTRLRAQPSFAHGVGLLRPIGAAAPRLAIKPGSYAWPLHLWPASAPAA